MSDGREMLKRNVMRAAAVCTTSSAKFMDAEMLQLLEPIFGISAKESEIEMFKNYARRRPSTERHVLVWQKYSHCVIRTFSHLSTVCYSCCLPSRRHLWLLKDSSLLWNA